MKKLQGVPVEGYKLKIEVLVRDGEENNIIDKLAEKNFKYYDSEEGLYNTAGEPCIKLYFIKDNSGDEDF